MNEESIKGIDVTTLPVEELIRKVFESVEGKEKQKIIVCANPHSIVLAMDDDEFRQSLKNADLCLPDGAGVVLASKILGGAIKKRIAGPDFFVKLTEYGNGNRINLRYFFLGSTENNLLKIKRRMDELYPYVSVSGTYSPPMGEWAEDENVRITDLIDRSGANVLWVGLGAPKQEKWIFQNRSRLNVKVIAAIGAAFDFFAGTKRRSPKIFRDLGFEWLPRFLMEPKRLWKRNAISTPRFLYLIAKEKIRAGRATRL